MKLHLAFTFALTLSVPAFARQTPQQIADAELPSLITIYKDLHTHPELSTHEERSAAIVAKELKAAGCEVTERVGKYDKPGLTCFGVIGVMKNGDGPVVAVRPDLNALPVHEETGVPYASTVTTKNDAGQEVSVMHACGHDIHMSTFIGTARALGKLKDKWHGTVIFIGQPAEETVGGARALLKDGLYTRWPKPSYVLGLHDDAEIATGKIGVTEGYCYANVDSVDVTVKGMGGHGAYPHKTKDAIERIAKGIATTAGVPADHAPDVHVEKDQYTPATYNNPELTKRVTAALKSALGNDNVIPKDPTMGGEDFSEYSLPDHSIPAFMFNVGAVDPAKVAESKKPGALSLPSLHSSKFAPVPEPTIRTGIIGMTSAVLDLMKK